jgi:hypothetical protein
VDDESGLIYMRARYYEPGSGRFMNQDNRCAGKNWFMYCGGNPVDLADGAGANWQKAICAFGGSLAEGVGVVMLTAAVLWLVDATTPGELLQACVLLCIGEIYTAIAMSIAGMSLTGGIRE